MKLIYLLPYSFKKVGWLLFLASVILLVLGMMLNLDSSYFTFRVFSVYSSKLFGPSDWFAIHPEEVAYTVVSCLFITGALFIMFSKEKVEDEFIMSIRMNALMWAVLIHFTLLLILFITVYGINFGYVVIYNIYTLLVIFILRYYYLLYQYKNQFSEE